MSIFILIPLIILYFIISYYFEKYRLNQAKKILTKINDFLDSWELEFINNHMIELDDYKPIKTYSYAFSEIKESILNSYWKKLIIKRKPNFFKTDFFHSDVIDKKMYVELSKKFNNQNNLEKTIYLLPEFIEIGKRQCLELIRPPLSKKVKEDFSEIIEDCKTTKKKIKKKMKKLYLPKNHKSINLLMAYEPEWLTEKELNGYSNLLNNILIEIKKVKNPKVMEYEIEKGLKFLDDKYSTFFEKQNILNKYYEEQNLWETYEMIIFRMFAKKKILSSHNYNKSDEKKFTKEVNYKFHNPSEEIYNIWTENKEFKKTIANNV